MTLSEYFPRQRVPVLLFTLAYIVGFSALFIAQGNFEFIIYTVVMLLALALIVYLLRDMQMPSWLLWMISLTGVLHMMGGGLYVHGERLYAYHIIDIWQGGDPDLVIFKYDQFVHFIGYAVGAAALYYLLRITGQARGAFPRILLAIFTTMGIASVNEIAEFTAVLALPTTGVGDYYNTCLDLIFNSLGAIVGATTAYWLLRKRRQ
jgi:hypothetical protein